LAWTAFTSGCAPKSRAANGAAAGSGAFRYTEGQEIDNLNPILTSEIVVNDLSTLTQGYLFTFDERGELIPSLSLEIPTQRNRLISADGKTITYRLRRGAVWHDGAPFTSADIAFSVKTILDPHVNAASTLIVDDVARLETPGPYDVVVHLKRPNAAFVARFLAPGAGSGILPKHILEGQDVNRAPFNSLPVGLGPFRYVRWARGSEVEMAAFDRWWGGRPKLNTIAYRIVSNAETALNQIRANDLDAFGRFPNDLLPAAAGIPGTRVIDFDTGAYEHVDFNMTSPILADRRVRQALAHAIDVHTIVTKVDHGSGYLTCSPIPHYSWAFDAHTPCFAFDLAAAGRLLDEAGWRMGSDGVRHRAGRPLRLTLVSTVGNFARDQTAVLIQSWFGRIGVELTSRRFQANQIFAKREGILDRGIFDLALYSYYWGADPDISDLFTCDKAPPRGQNESRYCNREVDALLADALSHYDRARRRADYVRVQELIAADVPSVILYQPQGHVIARDGVRHLDPGPLNLFSHPAEMSN
jgi:peptide/nickel transport system substrate-binding protein